MAYTVKIRTLPGSPMMAEYHCPHHGTFELLVTRDKNGDPPPCLRCTVITDKVVPVDLHYAMRPAAIGRCIYCHEPFDGPGIPQEGCDGDHDVPIVCSEYRTEPCGAISNLIISAPSIKFWSRDPVPIGRASKSDEWDPRALDTRPLAEGKMTKAEWSKWQRDKRTERRHQKKLKSGRISKRIQVG